MQRNTKSFSRKGAKRKYKGAAKYKIIFTQMRKEIGQGAAKYKIFFTQRRKEIGQGAAKCKIIFTQRRKEKIQRCSEIQNHFHANA